MLAAQPGKTTVTFTLEENEYLQAEEVRRFFLGKSFLLKHLTFVAALCWVTAADLYMHGLYQTPVALGLMGACALWWRFSIWTRRTRQMYRENPRLQGPFTVEADAQTISLYSDLQTAKIPWIAISRVHEAKDIVVGLGESGAIVLPKRGFVEQPFQDVLNRLCAQRFRGGFSARYPYLAGWIVKGMITALLLILFAGDLYLLQRAAFTSVRQLLSAAIEPFYGAYLHRLRLQANEVADVHKLKGRGEIFLVPLGRSQRVLSSTLIEDYQRKYGVTTKVLDPVPLPTWARDPQRRQLVAEELILAIKHAYPEHAARPGHVLIGVTDEDMYISSLGWEFAFNFRRDGQFGVISTARLSGATDSQPGVLEPRFRKLLTKNLGVLYYGLRLSGNPFSVMNDNVRDENDLDLMVEDFSRTDVRSGRGPFIHDGDPCITVHRHLDAAHPQGDELFLSGCNSLTRQLDVEIVEVDLRYGLFTDRRTEFSFPDRIPLQFSRVVRNQDGRSRAFGIGGNHSLNIFPVGNSWPFTWMDLSLEDGGRFHYKRANWGVAYWDALYAEQGEGATEFSGSVVSWSWPGWEIKTTSGRTYVFPAANGSRPEQWSLSAVQDQDSRLDLIRDTSGDLLTARSPSGIELRFKYDDMHRITRVETSTGAWAEYEYDADGYLMRAASPEQITEYRRGNRALSILQNGRLLIESRYDELDRVTALRLADGRAYSFTYTTNASDETTAVDVLQPGGSAFQVQLMPGSYTLTKSIQE